MIFEKVIFSFKRYSYLIRMCFAKPANIYKSEFLKLSGRGIRIRRRLKPRMSFESVIFEHSTAKSQIWLFSLWCHGIECLVSNADMHSQGTWSMKSLQSLLFEFNCPFFDSFTPFWREWLKEKWTSSSFSYKKMGKFAVYQVESWIEGQIVNIFIF